MDEAVVHQILDLNRQFYQTFAVQFSATRRRLQPGVKRWLPRLLGAGSILDLGCGNGELRRQLEENQFAGRYLGLDISAGLLEEVPERFKMQFRQADLAAPGWESGLEAGSYDIVLALAVLHHLPGAALRQAVVKSVRSLLAPGGRFLLSNWQFLSSQRLRERTQPWEKIGLAETAVEPGDYLLDWRQGGMGMRYVHHFAEPELRSLANGAAFKVAETFWSDGENGRLSLYQVWEPVE